MVLLDEVAILAEGVCISIIEVLVLVCVLIDGDGEQGIRAIGSKTNYYLHIIMSKQPILHCHMTMPT